MMPAESILHNPLRELMSDLGKKILGLAAALHLFAYCSLSHVASASYTKICSNASDRLAVVTRNVIHYST